MYINKLYNIVNEYKNTYHKTTKMKPVDVKNDNDKDPKFKVGDQVWILKYKNIFTDGYTPN